VYREQLRKERENVAGFIYGKTHHDLDPKELAQLEKDVNEMFPDEMFSHPEYANLVMGIKITIENILHFFYYHLLWRPFLQGNVELDYMHKHHQTAAQYANAQMNSFNEGSGSPRSPKSPVPGGGSKSPVTPQSSRSLKWSGSKMPSIREKISMKENAEKQSLALSKGASYKPGQHMLSRAKDNTSHHEYMKHHASVKMMSFREGDELELDAANAVAMEGEGGGSSGMPSKLALSGQVPTSETDAANSILGFPKDCGPRSGVRILSYQRAIHVRNLNHPHLTFERAGSGVESWYCISEGFFDTKITDCIEV
jgi:hypothetical protein